METDFAPVTVKCQDAEVVADTFVKLVAKPLASGHDAHCTDSQSAEGGDLIDMLYELALALRPLYFPGDPRLERADKELQRLELAHLTISNEGAIRDLLRETPGFPNQGCRRRDEGFSEMTWLHCGNCYHLRSYLRLSFAMANQSSCPTHVMVHLLVPGKGGTSHLQVLLRAAPWNTSLGLSCVCPGRMLEDARKRGGSLQNILLFAQDSRSLFPELSVFTSLLPPKPKDSIAVKRWARAVWRKVFAKPTEQPLLIVDFGQVMRVQDYSRMVEPSTWRCLCLETANDPLVSSDRPRVYQGDKVNDFKVHQLSTSSPPTEETTTRHYPPLHPDKGNVISTSPVLTGRGMDNHA